MELFNFSLFKGLFHFEMTGMNRNTNNNTNGTANHTVMNDCDRGKKKKRANRNKNVINIAV